MNELLSKKYIILQAVLIFFWGVQLLDSEANYVVYALLLCLAFVALLLNLQTGVSAFGRNQKCSKKESLIIRCFAVLFTGMITLSNYKMWSPLFIFNDYGERFKIIYGLLVLTILAIGGYIACCNILLMFYSRIDCILWTECDNKTSPFKYFAIIFIILLFTRLFLLFICEYPGEFAPDGAIQTVQIMSGEITNHHPIWHTFLIKACIDMGNGMFGNINAGIAIYSVLQIIATSLCFSYAVSTLVYMKAPKWITICVSMFYVLMPYHIVYALTVWKDTLFGCFVLLLMSALYRLIMNLGNKVVNLVATLIGGMGMCLFRSNGLFAFTLLTVIFIALWKKEKVAIWLTLILIAVSSFTMKHFVVNALDISQPDRVESLSVPLQQVARVVYEGYELKEWEQSCIEAVADIEDIRLEYEPWISDPIKELIREKGNQTVIEENGIYYLKLYISLGLKHPFAYARAWIDETVGYWNSSYDYWFCFTGVKENDYGIERQSLVPGISRILCEYIFGLTGIQGFRVLVSIGFFVWADILLFMVSILRKDKTGLIMSVPILAIVLSLLLATPVFAEFRYIYTAFCCLPMVIVI